MPRTTNPDRFLLEAARDRLSPYPKLCGPTEQKRIDKCLKSLLARGLIRRRLTQRNHEPFVVLTITPAGSTALARLAA